MTSFPLHFHTKQKRIFLSFLFSLVSNTNNGSDLGEEREKEKKTDEYIERELNLEREIDKYKETVMN